MPKFSIVQLRHVLLLVGTIFAVGRLHADTTYTYTGQPYNPNPPTFCNGTYVPVCSSIGVSGSVTFANALGDNLNFAFVTPVSFSFSGGTNAFLLTQSSTLPLEAFQFSTDGNGNITAWAIVLADNLGPSDGCNSGGNQICLGTSTSDGDYSAFDFNHGTPDEVFGGGQNHVDGTWATAAATTPEPFSIVLLGTGGLLAILRRRNT